MEVIHKGTSLLEQEDEHDKKRLLELETQVILSFLNLNLL